MCLLVFSKGILSVETATATGLVAYERAVRGGDHRHEIMQIERRRPHAFVWAADGAAACMGRERLGEK